MSRASLVESYRSSGVLLGLRGGELRYLAEPGRMTPELAQSLKDNRAAILRELAGAVQLEGKWQAPEGVELWADDAPVDVETDPRVDWPPFEILGELNLVHGPHDPPLRGCYACSSREFVRVRGGPMWFCPRCHPPEPGAVVERREARDA